MGLSYNCGRFPSLFESLGVVFISFFFLHSSAGRIWVGGAGGVFISKSSPISVVSSFCFLFLSISFFFNASLSLWFEIDVILSLHICLSF